MLPSFVSVFLAAAAVLVVSYVSRHKGLRKEVRRRYLNKNVIITGASSGIGKQFAIKIAELGARNIVIAARRQDKLEATAAECAEVFKKHGHLDSKVHILCIDLAKEEECQKLIDASISDFFSTSGGRIDLLFLNAGLTSVKRFKSFEDLSVHRYIMDVNYWGSVAPVFFAMPHLRKQPLDPSTGNICTIAVVSSMAGKIGVKYRTAYSPAKFALLGFFDALRAELFDEGPNGGPLPIQITIHYPGFVLTEIHDQASGGGAIKRTDLKKFWTVEKCVDEMIKAQSAGVFEHVLDPSGRIFLALMPLVPRWIVDMVRRRREAGVAPDKE